MLAKDNMTKKELSRCIIVSAVIAVVMSFCSITATTTCVRTNDVDATALRQSGFQKSAQWIETQNSTPGRGAATLHSFSYPGFWLFWMRSALLLFVSILAGAVSVTVWNQKMNCANQPSDRTR